MERSRIHAIEITEYDFNCGLRSFPRYIWLTIIGITIGVLLLIFFLTLQYGHTIETKFIVASTSPVNNLNATLTGKTLVPVPVINEKEKKEMITTEAQKTIIPTTEKAQKTTITTEASTTIKKENPNEIWNTL